MRFMRVWTAPSPRRPTRRSAGRGHAARDRSGLAATDQVIVDLADRDELGSGAGQEHLVGEVQLRPSEVALDDLMPEIAGDLQGRLAADPVEDGCVRVGE